MTYFGLSLFPAAIPDFHMIIIANIQNNLVISKAHRKIPDTKRHIRVYQKYILYIDYI